MDFRHLETFLWVTRLGSFGAAANHLNTTQPAISRRIRRLEASLGVRLFKGNTRNMSLTSRGRDLVDHAAGAVALMTAIRREVGQGDRVTGLLRLGATDVIALTWLPDLVARIRQTYPSLSVELLIDLTVNLRARLDRGELDVAILFGPVAANHLVPRPMGLVEVGWMASPGLGLPAGVLTPADLARHPVVSHTKGTDHYHMMRKWFMDSGVNLPLFNGCSSLSTLIQLTLSGIGSSILPLRLMRDEIAAGRLRAIDTDPPIPPNLFEAVYPLDSLQSLDVEIVAMAAECAAADPVFDPVPGARPGVDARSVQKPAAAADMLRIDPR